MNLLKEIKEKVERPFPVKLAETREIIADHFEEFGDRAAVAFSGGKDSELVLYFCLERNPNVPLVFNNTGVEYPETVKFIAHLAELWKLNLTVTHPEKSFWDCVAEYGFPRGTKWRETKAKVALGWKGNVARCCYWLKEKPMLLAIRRNGYLGYFAGETATESRLRMFAARRGTCLHLKKEKVCKIKPILWWTEDEVWAFIRKEGLPVNEAYLKGARRIGCMPCTAYKNWEEQMQKLNPKLYRIIKLRKEKQYMMQLEA